MFSNWQKPYTVFWGCNIKDGKCSGFNLSVLFCFLITWQIMYHGSASSKVEPFGGFSAHAEWACVSYGHARDLDHDATELQWELCCHCWSVAESCLTLRTRGLYPARLFCPRAFPGKNTGVGCHFLLQGIFLTQGSNPHLQHWQQVEFITTEPSGKPQWTLYKALTHF